MNKAFALILLALGLQAHAAESLEYSTSAPGQVSVVAEGVASTRDGAIAKSLVAAANQAVGVLIVSTKKVQNDQLVSDDTMQQTAGIVNKYEVIYCNLQSDNLYWCQVRALVATKPLIEYLQTKGAKAFSVDGASEYAKQVSYRTAIASSSELLLKTIADINSTGLDLKVRKSSFEPTSSNYVKLNLELSLGINEGYKEYLKEVVTQAEKSLKARNGDLEICFKPIWLSADCRTLTPDWSKGKEWTPALLTLHFQDEQGRDIDTICLSTAGMYRFEIQRFNDWTYRFLKMIDGTIVNASLKVPEDRLQNLKELQLSVGCEPKARRFAV